jgi:hypothetical protein
MRNGEEGIREEGPQAIDKAVRKAIKSGISGGLFDQTVATSIHAATVKAARNVVAPTKEVVKGEKDRLAQEGCKGSEKN